jgi:CRP/FNR family transcriptional regulator, polysaccharide utilization system transcription regulator
MAKNILIVEDNDDLRENISEILELAGFDVVTAVDGIEGLKAMHTSSPDLVICDIMMPKLDGYGVLKAMKSNPRLSHLPLIFLTAKAEKEDFRSGMNLGAVDYLTKPFDAAELIEVVQVRLSQSNPVAAQEHPQQGFNIAPGNFFTSIWNQEKYNHCEHRNFPKKSVIYQYDTNTRFVYFVASGCIKASKTTDNGRELIIDMFVAGDMFGYDDVLMQSRHDVTCQTIMDSVIVLLPIDEFKREMSHPPFVKALLSYQMSRARAMSHRMPWLGLSSLRKKVAESLIYLMGLQHGSDLSIMREDLAALAGVAKESLSRTLTDFKDEGLITTQDHQIQLLKIDKLLSMPD